MKKQDANARREELRKLSKQLKDSNKIAVARGVRVNDLLIDYYNEAFKTTELNTYEQWKNKGTVYFFTTMRHSAIHGAKREFMTKSIHDALHQFIQSVGTALP